MEGALPILKSLPQLDALRNDPNTTWTRDEGSNLDVLSTTGDDPDLAICHFYSLHPFTYGDDLAVQFQFEDAAAIALAVHHLNTGDGRIVPQVEGLSDRCSVRFTVEFADTQLTPSVAVDHVVNAVSRPPGVEPRPCAFIGAYRSAVSIASSLLTGIWRYPQVSGVSTSADLDDKNQYPLFGRTIPSDHGNAVPIIQYMYDVLGIRHLAVLNINDAYGNSFVKGLRSAAERYAPDLLIHQAPVDGGLAAIQTALASIKVMQYRYIFALFFSEEVHDAVMTEAYSMGLAGNGEYQWLFGDSFDSIDGRMVEADSPLNLAYRGTGMVEATGGVRGVGLKGYDKFLNYVAEMNNTEDLDYLFSRLPNYDNEKYQNSIKQFTNFLTPVASVQAPFLYEVAVALGLAACAAVDPEKITLDGKRHYDTMVNSTFDGITGKVIFDPATGSKDPLHTLYKVTNYVDHPASNGTVRFKETVTHIYQEGAWKELTPFVFNDGSTAIPIDIPPVVEDDNAVRLGVRVGVLTLCGVVLILGVALMYWTHRHRKARVVLASQPFFLHIICMGVMVMACTIIPMSIDHDLVSLESCTRACISIPWLGAMGFSMTVSALFTKTHRINIILNRANRMQRIKVTAWDVAKPMMFLLSVNTIVLSVMTALSPPSYEKIVESTDSFGRANEVRGQCNFSESYAYIGSVSGVNLAALFFTIVQAIKARNLSMEFAESAQIFRALMTITTVMFVGGPVLLLSRDNANTFLFVASAIIFVACTSILLLLFVPKIRFWRKSTKQSDDSRRFYISGLELSQLGPASQRSMFNESYDERIDDNFQQFTGMRILTTKTTEELLVEIESLKRQVRQAIAIRNGSMTNLKSSDFMTNINGDSTTVMNVESSGDQVPSDTAISQENV